MNILKVLGILFLSGFASVAQADIQPPDGKVYDVAPFNYDSSMTGRIGCSGTFDCSVGVEDIEAKAKSCVKAAYNISPEAMGALQADGIYKNCVVPVNFMRDEDRKLSRWAICCYDPDAPNADGMCGTKCFRYQATDQ